MSPDNIPKMENLLIFKEIFILLVRYEVVIAVNISPLSSGV